jgi:hypothetical protein
LFLGIPGEFRGQHTYFGLELNMLSPDSLWEPDSGVGAVYKPQVFIAL